MSVLASAVVGLLAGTAMTNPAALLGNDAPAGFELADGAAVDLTFDEYAPLSPDSIAHVDPLSEEAQSMRAAVDVWTAGADDILVREVTHWATPEAARQFVEQSVVVGTVDDLRMIDPPFAGGVAFVGDDSGLRSRTLTWRQGPYAMSVSHFAARPSTDDIINATADALAEVVESETGNAIATRVLADGADPAGSADTSGGVSTATVITTALVWLLVIGGGAWLFMSVRRRRLATRSTIAALPRPPAD